MDKSENIKMRQARPGDVPALTKCFVDLQNFERLIEPRRRPGEHIASAYVKRLLQDCADRDGQVFVATVDNKIIGFICVFRGEFLDEQINEPTKVAYISDLVVSAALRNRGIGQLLMSTAEEYAKQSGISLVSVNVLTANEPACQFYEACGFKEYERTLLKTIS